MTPLGIVQGVVAPYGVRSSDGKYRIRPGAFRQAIASGRSRVPILIEHLDSLEITCTAQFWEDPLGLRTRITLDRDSRNESLIANLQDSKIYGHFSWRGGEQRSKAADGVTEIVKVDDLVEVSFVSKAHWPQTFVALTNVSDYVDPVRSIDLWEEVSAHRAREQRQRERQGSSVAMRRA